MKVWKIALVIWLPIIVLALIISGVLLYKHHQNQLKAQKAQAAAEQRAQQLEAVQSCQSQVHEKWDPLIQSAQAQGLPTYGSLAEEQSQLNKC